MSLEGPCCWPACRCPWVPALSSSDRLPGVLVPDAGSKEDQAMHAWGLYKKRTPLSWWNCPGTTPPTLPRNSALASWSWALAFQP